MSTLTEQLNAFQQFAMQQSQDNDASASLEEMFQRWQVSQMSPRELMDSLESLNRGLRDIAANQVVDAATAISDARQRLR